MKRAHLHALVFSIPIVLLSACSAGSGNGSSGTSMVPQVKQSQSLITLPTMTPVSANTFVDSIGVNTHFNYPAYNTTFATVEALLVSSGIRHIRDGFVTNPASAFVYFGYLQQLQSNGIHATMETSINMSPATILANTQAVPNFTEAIEGPNEYNISGDPAWATNLAAYQQTLYNGVKATPGLSSLPVIGPALTSAQAYAQVGNLSAYRLRWRRIRQRLRHHRVQSGRSGPNKRQQTGYCNRNRILHRTQYAQCGHSRDRKQIHPTHVLRAVACPCSTHHGI
jgi:hypothetical protein